MEALKKTIKKVFKKVSPHTHEIEGIDRKIDLIMQELFKDKSKMHSAASTIGELFFFDSALITGSYRPEVIREHESSPNGTYNFDDIEFEDGDTVLDVGAHVGTVSIFLAKTHPEVHVYAFEPSSTNYENLCKNIEINQTPNVTPIQKAVTFDGRDLSFVTLATSSQAHHAIGSALHKKGDGKNLTGFETVQSVSLDNFCQDRGIKKVKLLKIDCEGSEFEVLYNLQLLNSTTHLRGELHSSEEENNRLLSFLENFSDLKSMRFEHNQHGLKSLTGSPYYAEAKSDKSLR